MANTNFFNTGRDCSVVILHPLAPAGRLDLPIVTMFDPKVAWHDIKSSAIDGLTRTRHIFENATFSVQIDRSDATLDNFVMAMVRAYQVTGSVPDGSIFQYVTEADGSTTTTQGTGVSFKLDDLGSWKKDSAVPQTLTGTAMSIGRV